MTLVKPSHQASYRPKKHPCTSMPSHPSNHSSRHRLKTSRSRSRSPYRSFLHHRSPLQPRSRSRSPHRHDDRDSTRHKRKRSPQRPASLPFRARPLSKHGYAAYKPMFALYLDIQKQLVLEDLDEHEARGRWKSFIGKWYAIIPITNRSPTSQPDLRSPISEHPG